MSAARVAAAVSITLVLGVRAPHAQRSLQTLLPKAAAPEVSCGTSVDRELRGIHTYAATELRDGEVLSFDQDPALVPPAYSGTVTLRNFTVMGDLRTIQFRRADRPDAPPETWSRLTTKSVNGRLVSVFAPSWTEADLDAIASASVFGFDAPGLYWGSLLRPGLSPAYVYVRMALAGIPSSPVLRVNDRVQYASNVVNLVVPEFGDARAKGGAKAFELGEVSNLFYQFFQDRYDVIAVVPQTTLVVDYAAFHRNVQNRVTGLNLPLLDDSASYGSAGILQGIELYAATAATQYGETNHEMAHQWGSAFDWGRIAGIVRGGHEPSVHAPLWTGGETLLGAVLSSTRRVSVSTDGYVIERTPAPVHFHPLDLYAMGVLKEVGVPDFAVFTDQNQFDAMIPAAGTRVSGETRRVSIADVVRQHGIREGAVPTNWRRATILVSRDHLASQQEMDYWNFFAERLADRNGRGLAAEDGQVPFRVATNDAVTLSTEIWPRGHAALPQTLDTDTPAIGATDFRGVEFTSAIPGRFEPDRLVSLDGRVTATDAVDFDQIVVTFWREGLESPLTFSGDVTRSGDFSVPVRFPAGMRGRYVMSVYLFWRDSGPQYPRASLMSIFVE